MVTLIPSLAWCLKHICCERESLKLTDVTCLPPVSAGQPISEPDLRVDLTLP